MIESNNIAMKSEQTEMIKITREGFWVRGIKVEQTEQEAQQVYHAFKEWLMWANLTKNY